MDPPWRFIKNNNTIIIIVSSTTREGCDAMRAEGTSSFAIGAKIDALGGAKWAIGVVGATAVAVVAVVVEVG